MASNINQMLLIVSIASLLTLFPQADSSTLVSDVPAAAPGPASELPVDAKTQMTRFVESTMILGRQKAEEYLQSIAEQVNDSGASGPNLECLQECKELYEAVVDDMENTIEDMESGNYYKANVDISAVLANADTCGECYREMVGEDPDAKTFDKWIMGISSDCLDKLETVTS